MEDPGRKPSPELERGVAFLCGLQRTNGCVVGEVVWSPVITAQYVLVAYLIGQPIEPQRQTRFLHYFRQTRAMDGSWGLHPESGGYVFVTVLVYVALRLLGLPAEDPLCTQARVWLREHGGVESIPSWGKLWLAMMNLYGYEGINPVLPEAWLLPSTLPVHPSQLYCHTRLIYLGFSYLYGVRFQRPVNELIQQLRRELYQQPFEAITFHSYRHALAPTDVYIAPNWLLRQLSNIEGWYERHHRPALRQRALRWVIEQIVFHHQQTNGVSLSPVNGLLNVLALSHAGYQECESAFRGLDYWAWKDVENGERFCGALSHTWDTTFAVQAICEGPASETASSFLGEAARYLKQAQIAQEAPQRQRFYQDSRLGGFCFSDERHQWPVSDCTAEALSALSYLDGRIGAEVQFEPTRIVDAIRFVLSRQNADGGWGSFERRRGPLFLERLNPFEMFANCMVEHSYIECTGSCLHGLRRTLERFQEVLPSKEQAQVHAAIGTGAAWLRKEQQADGSWPGFWGIHYTYGTLFGITGLLASGADRSDEAIVRACRWLVKARLADGGWGESWQGLLEKRSVPHACSQVIMTSWALMALLRAGYQGNEAQEAIASGIQLLKERQLPNGDWPEEAVAGVFFNTAMLHYRLYKNYFPLWALGLYENTLREYTGADDASR
jgi:lanosterol synthase